MGKKRDELEEALMSKAGLSPEEAHEIACSIYGEDEPDTWETRQVRQHQQQERRDAIKMRERAFADKVEASKFWGKPAEERQNRNVMVCGANRLSKYFGHKVNRQFLRGMHMADPSVF